MTMLCRAHDSKVCSAGAVGISRGSGGAAKFCSGAVGDLQRRIDLGGRGLKLLFHQCLARDGGRARFCRGPLQVQVARRKMAALTIFYRSHSNVVYFASAAYLWERRTMPCPGP
jgi:hypothetical protein